MRKNHFRLKYTVMAAVLMLVMSGSLWAVRFDHLPQTIAQNLLQALQARDFSAARAYVLPDQFSMLDMLQGWGDTLGWVPAITPAAPLTLVDCRINERQAIATFRVGERGEARIFLDCTSGSWLVDLAQTTFRITVVASPTPPSVKSFRN